MKTLKLSSLAAIFACLTLFTSCTKDLESAAPSSSSDNLSAAARKGAAGETATESEDKSNKGNQKATPAFATFELVSNPATVGNMVQMNVVVTFSEPIKQAVFNIEKATEKDAGGNWTGWQVVDGFGSQLNLKKSEEGVTSHAFTNAFKAEAAGETAWRIHTSGSDVNNVFSNAEVLVVRDCVNEFTIVPKVTGKDNNDGTYDITVSYTLTSPEAIQNLKFQGGATSGGGFNHKMGTVIGFNGQKDNKQNTVLTYEGPLQACKPLLLSFTYTRAYSCATTAATVVTGDWKATINNVVVKELAPLTWSCQN